MTLKILTPQNSTENSNWILSPDKSVFLVGPTPRSKSVKSWRPEAINIFKELGYNGYLLVPEPFSQKGYEYQIEWEHYHLEHARKILCWIPRNLETMPGFTTNIEFGMYVSLDKLYYGRPDNSPHTNYMDYTYKKVTERKPKNTLRELIQEVIA